MFAMSDGNCPSCGHLNERHRNPLMADTFCHDCGDDCHDNSGLTAAELGADYVPSTMNWRDQIARDEGLFND